VSLERDIQHAIRLALGADPRVVLWRNDVGAGERKIGSKTIHTRYGLAVGSSDLIGLLAPSGRFLALEVKTETGRVSADQTLFINLVRSKGGFAAVVRSVDDALQAIERASAGATE
jgi:hypothetical protein